MTYLLLSSVFLTVAVLIAVLAVALQRRADQPMPFSGWALAAAAVVLLFLTAVFDNVMIAVGLFYYAEEQISGLSIGLAPLEDFSYPLAALILLPALWVLSGRIFARRGHDAG